MLDLDAYLTRVGLGSDADIHGVHLAHSTAIPFENLQPYAGGAVSLEPADLERKLVHERRGGYCFEQNLLLKAALEALGAEVDTYLARVRLGAPPGTLRPRSHLVLRARLDGEEWLADVGFGLGTLFEPLPFAIGAEGEQRGWGFRIAEGGEEIVLEGRAADGVWAELYGFVPHPAPMVDIETSNWWVCTHPRSPFVTGLVVALQSDDGLRLSLSDWDGLTLIERRAESSSVTSVERTEIPGLLASRFGLEGFALGEDGRVRPAAR
jgi:N-hydroxyarylamine O-acetyltransferase